MRVSSTGDPAQPGGLDGEVVSVEDRLAITDLLARYGLFTDQGRIDELAALFTEDAEYLVPGLRPLVTTEDRCAMLRSAPRGLHLSASPVIHPGANPDSAHAEQSFLFRALESGRMSTGWYEDDLVRIEQHWLIARRVITFHR